MRKYFLYIIIRYYNIHNLERIINNPFIITNFLSIFIELISKIRHVKVPCFNWLQIVNIINVRAAVSGMCFFFRVINQIFLIYWILQTRRDRPKIQEGNVFVAVGRFFVARHSYYRVSRLKKREREREQRKQITKWSAEKWSAITNARMRSRSNFFESFDSYLTRASVTVCPKCTLKTYFVDRTVHRV